MIIISEKPTIIGKLIHLNPQFYQSPRKIAEALDKEQPIEAKSGSKLSKPQDCPLVPLPSSTPSSMARTTS